MSLKPWYREQHGTVGAGAGLGQVNIGKFCSQPQPVVSRDGQVALVCYGEISNLADLQDRLTRAGHGAAEGGMPGLLVRLYEVFGREFLGMLDGFFVLAIWDGHHRSLLVANDRLGLVPVFYAHQGGRFMFANQVKAISQQAGFDRQLNLAAVAQFFRFQRLLGENTFFEGIRWLRHGSCLVYEADRDCLSQASYWDFDRLPEENRGISFGEAVEETGRLLGRAVEKCLQGEQRLGIYLTGGLDSRTILGFSRRLGADVSTITYGIPGCRDLVYAARLAKQLGAEHHAFPQENGRWMQEHVPFHLEATEGFTTLIHSHAAISLEPARQWMDVNLTGFNGDQLLGCRVVDHFPVGFAGLSEASFLTAIFQYHNQYSVWPGITEADEKQLYLPQVYNHTRDAAFESLRDDLRYYQRLPYERRADFISQVNQCVHLSHFNMVYQRAYMENRYPFCDYPLMNFVYSLPMDFRKQDRLYLAVINREIPRVTRVPRDTDDMLLTDRTWIRRVHGSWQKTRRIVNRHLFHIFPEFPTFHSDPGGWVRRDLRDWAAGILFDKRALERGILDPAFVRSVFDLHMSGVELYSIGKLAPLITFEMMMRRFFDE